MKRYFITLFLFLFYFGSKINAQTINNYAGGGTTLGDGGFAILSQVTLPACGSFDGFGNYYFYQAFGASRIREVNTAGIINTVVGTGVSGYSGDNGPAIAAKIHPSGFKLDSVGNIYIADYYNYRVRKVDKATGIIHTIAGNGTPTHTGDNGLAIAATITPSDLCIDKYGNLYVTDSARIRKIDTFGIITTIAGTGIGGFSGDSGLATNAQITVGVGISFDGNGNLFFGTNGGVRIRKIDMSTGVITTVAGTGVYLYNGDGIHADSAQFKEYGIAFDASNNLFIADYGNQRIRMVDTSGIIHTIAGTGVAGYSGDGGLADTAKIYNPEGIAVDACQNIYIADEANNRIRKVWFNTDTLPQVNVAIAPNDTVITGTQVTTTASATNHGTITSYHWVKNGANASTTNSYTYIPTNGDSLYCIVTTRACTGRTYTDTTQVLHITVTGDAGITNTTNQTTHTYPNPVRDMLNISTKEPQHYLLHNLMGITLLQGTVDKNNSIDMKAISSGIYLLQLTNTQGQREVVRVVKE